MNTSKRIHQMTVPQWEKAFPDDDACAAYLAKHRWPMAAHCPHCCSDSTYELTTMKCALPAARAGPTASPCSLAGSSKIPNIGLRMWIRVIHVMLTSKKDVSAHQICPTMGFCSYRTAWHMCHRVRAGLADEKFHKLIGIVEVDEIYVGGKTKISIGASPVPILAAKDLAKPS